MTERRKALDTFSGARGWDIAAHELGWETHGVEIMPEARATAEANGFRHVGTDVRDFRTAPGEYDLHLSSPSCKKFSPAGDGSGRRSMATILRAVEMIGGGFPVGNVLGTVDLDARLVVEPLRLALGGMPRAIAWEQASSVLPIWQACADVLIARGYSVMVDVLDAANYGVPQNRKRAVLLARRDRTALLPERTHGPFPHLASHVSLATALGWTEDMYVVSNYGTGGDPRKRGIRTADQPSFAVISKADRNRVVRAKHHHGSGMEERHGVRPGRAADQPSYTVRANAGGTAPGGWRFEMEDGTTRKLTEREAAALQTFPEGYVFCGTKTKRMEQIGNAVPPVLARALLSTLL